MKYRIVGWTEYDNCFVETEGTSYAASNVVIDEIKKRGYSFSGWAHQELTNGAPVFNDGKKRLFSARTFGGLMARAHGYNGSMDYARFAFENIDEDQEKTPPLSQAFDVDTFVPETDLNEEYVVVVSEEVFEKTVETGLFVCEEREEFRYMEEGDTLTLRCGEKVHSKKILDVWGEKALTEEDRVNLYLGKKSAERKWRNAKINLNICIEGYQKPVFKGFETIKK